jgi:hypothetical protein
LTSADDVGDASVIPHLLAQIEGSIASMTAAFIAGVVAYEP